MVIRVGSTFSGEVPMIPQVQALPKHVLEPALPGLFLYLILVVAGCTEEVTKGTFEKTAPGCFEIHRAEKWPGPARASFCQAPGTRFPVVDRAPGERGPRVALTGLGHQAAGQWFWTADLQRIGSFSMSKGSEF